MVAIDHLYQLLNRFNRLSPAPPPPLPPHGQNVTDNFGLSEKCCVYMWQVQIVLHIGRSIQGATKINLYKTAFGNFKVISV